MSKWVSEDSNIWFEVNYTSPQKGGRCEGEMTFNGIIFEIFVTFNYGGGLGIYEKNGYELGKELYSGICRFNSKKFVVKAEKEDTDEEIYDKYKKIVFYREGAE